MFARVVRGFSSLSVLFAVPALALLAMPAVWWRGTQARPDERRRVRRFVAAFVLGLAPFAIEVLIKELVPSYKTFVSLPAVKPWVAIVLFLPLALVPFATAYSVFFDAVVHLRIVLRAALQQSCRWRDFSRSEHERPREIAIAVEVRRSAWRGTREVGPAQNIILRSFAST